MLLADVHFPNVLCDVRAASQVGEDYRVKGSDVEDTIFNVLWNDMRFEVFAS